MTFYGRCLGADPSFTAFSAGPPEVLAMAKDAPDRILHAELATGPAVLMASDTLPGMPFQQGSNFSICLDCESQAEMAKVFNALSENGQVTMPMHDAFWGGRFGMLTDQFGMLDVQLSRSRAVDRKTEERFFRNEFPAAIRDAPLRQYLWRRTVSLQPSKRGDLLR